jgi:hypothetical protein
MTEHQTLSQAFANHPVGVLIGIALIMIVYFIGLSLLFHGWPKFGKK